MLMCMGHTARRQTWIAPTHQHEDVCHSDNHLAERDSALLAATDALDHLVAHHRVHHVINAQHARHVLRSDQQGIQHER